MSDALGLQCCVRACNVKGTLNLLSFKLCPFSELFAVGSHDDSKFMPLPEVITP